MVGHLSFIWSTLAAFSSSVITTEAWAVLSLYSMSSGVDRTVAGMGMTPTFIIPSIQIYHSGNLGSMMNARSPFRVSMSPRTLPNLFDNTFRSQNVWRSAPLPDGSTETRASLVWSSAHRSITSNPKLKYSGISRLNSETQAS